MRAVYELSEGKDRYLVSPAELLAALPAKRHYREEILERTLHALAIDGYFDLILSERKGEKTYVFHMHEAGLAYRRIALRQRRGLLFKFLIAVASAAVTFFAGILLKLIFRS